MPRRKNMANNTFDSDYLKGYYDGMRDTYDSSEFDAYYAGVGFGKMQAKDKHLGFNSNEERQAFERGIENKDKHFKSIRAYRSFWERLLGIGRKEHRKDRLKIKNSYQNVKRVKKNWKGGRNADNYLVTHDIAEAKRKIKKDKKRSARDARKNQRYYVPGNYKGSR